MQAQSSAGVSVWMTKAGSAITNETVTGWGSGTAEIELTAATGIIAGDYLEISNGSALGKLYPITGVVTNTVTLAGFDHTGTTAPASVSVIKKTDMVKLCLAGLTVNSNTGATISVGTFCNPSASIPSVVQEAGTLEMTGFIDSAATDYHEIVKASQDGHTRFVAIDLPNGNGSLTTAGVVGRIAYDIPLDGALGIAANLVMNVPLEHFYS